MEILEGDDEGALLGEPLDERLDHLEGPVLEGFGREAGEPCLRLALERQIEKRTEVGIELVCAPAEQPLGRPA